MTNIMSNLFLLTFVPRCLQLSLSLEKAGVVERFILGCMNVKNTSEEKSKRMKTRVYPCHFL